MMTTKRLTAEDLAAIETMTSEVRLSGHVPALIAEVRALTAERDALRDEADLLRKSYDAATAQLGDAVTEQLAVTGERDAARTDLARVTAERDELRNAILKCADVFTKPNGDRDARDIAVYRLIAKVTSTPDVVRIGMREESGALRTALIPVEKAVLVGAAAALAKPRKITKRGAR